MSLFRRRTTPSAQRGPTPRDVEALEQVLLAFDGGVADAQDARVKFTDALVDALGLTYGARWVPAADGALRLAYETGALAVPLRAAVAGAAVLGPGAGLLGEAARSRRPVLVDAAEGDAPACLRWEAARTRTCCGSASSPAPRVRSSARSRSPRRSRRGWACPGGRGVPVTSCPCATWPT